MADAIINCLFAVVSLIAFYVLYIFAIAEFMPRFLLSPSYQKHVPTDKGVGKYKFPEGRGVVCVPDEKYKSYLKEYALFLYKNKKYIKCRLSDETVSIRYEVAVYNYKNRLIRVIDLAENIEVKGESKTVRLPDNTAYVSVILKAVNEQKRFSTLRHTSFAKICTFSVLTVAMTVACGLLTRAAILSFAVLLNINFQIGLWLNLILSLILGVFVAFLCLKIRKKQILGEG